MAPLSRRRHGPATRWLHRSDMLWWMAEDSRLGAARGVTITVVVCAYNEAVLLAPCLFSLLSQTRPPDEILVINNASTDETGAVARAVPGVRVVDEPLKGLVVAREAARRVVAREAARRVVWVPSSAA